MKKLLICLVLAGCSPSTWEEIRWEAESETKKLAQELGQLSSREAVQKAVPRLRARYLKLAKLVSQIQGLSQGLNPGLVPEPSFASEELFIQLARLYEIPGAKEGIESAQAEAIAWLDRRR